jgi:hypothetical protein
VSSGKQSEEKEIALSVGRNWFFLRQTSECTEDQRRLSSAIYHPDHKGLGTLNRAIVCSNDSSGKEIYF